MRTPPCSASSAGAPHRGPVRRQEQVGSLNLVETRGIEPLSGTESSETSPGAVSVWSIPLCINPADRRCVR